MESSLWTDKQLHQRAVLRAFLMFTIVSNTLFASTNLFRQHYPLASIEIMLALVSIVLYRLIKETRHLMPISFIYLLLNFSVVMMAVATAPMDSGLFIWMTLIPLMSYLLLGMFYGFIMTAVFVILGLFMLALAPHTNMVALANTGLAVLVIWAMAYVYEGKRQQVFEGLQEAAARDPLTGLLNRLHLEDAFGKARVSNSQMILLLVDLDHFKGINDQYGHDGGDQVLKDCAALLRHSTRRNDWLFRIGGEEFCALLPGASSTDAVSIAEGLQRRIADNPSHCAEQTIRYTISMGMACWPDDGENFATLYRCADQRLYQAKEQGRNCIVSAHEAPQT